MSPERPFQQSNGQAPERILSAVERRGLAMKDFQRTLRRRRMLLAADVDQIFREYEFVESPHPPLTLRYARESKSKVDVRVIKRQGRVVYLDASIPSEEIRWDLMDKKIAELKERENRARLTRFLNNLP